MYKKIRLAQAVTAGISNHCGRPTRMRTVPPSESDAAPESTFRVIGSLETALARASMAAMTRPPSICKNLSRQWACDFNAVVRVRLRNSALCRQLR